jgi:hypothetical protein
VITAKARNRILGRFVPRSLTFEYRAASIPAIPGIHIATNTATAGYNLKKPVKKFSPVRAAIDKRSTAKKISADQPAVGPILFNSDSGAEVKIRRLLRLRRLVVSER